MSADPSSSLPARFSVMAGAMRNWVHVRVERWKQSVITLARARPALFTMLVVGGAVAVVGAAPMLWDVWLAYWALPRAGWVAATAVGGAVSLFAGRRLWPRRHPPSGMPLVHLIGWAWAGACTIVGLLVLGAWWVLGAPSLSLPSEVSARAMDSAATRAFAVVAGLGGVALLVISYRKQRSTEAEGRRADLAVDRETTRLFVDRLDQASGKLDSEHAVIRLAGVHALAHLADDAPTEELAQTVIDILCGYLRMPYPPKPPRICNASEEVMAANDAAITSFAGMQQVRHTIIRLIKERLTAESRWRGKNFDFTGAVFDGGDFIGCHFTGGIVSFAGALFSPGESFSFERCDFDGANVSFRDCTFAGKSLYFIHTKFRSGIVDFGGASFEGDSVSLSAMYFLGGRVVFSDVLFSSKMAMLNYVVSGGEVEFKNIKLRNTKLLFFECKFDAGRVDFIVEELESSVVAFIRPVFSGSKVSFVAANEFSHQISIQNAEISGGYLDFLKESDSNFRSGVVAGACPKGLLESIRGVSRTFFSLPEKWRRGGHHDDPEESVDR